MASTSPVIGRNAAAQISRATTMPTRPVTTRAVRVRRRPEHRAEDGAAVKRIRGKQVEEQQDPIEPQA